MPVPNAIPHNMRTLFSLLIFLWTVPSFSHGLSVGQPQVFIENKGQWPSQVSFMSQIPGGYFFVSNHAFRTILFKSVKRHGGSEIASKTKDYLLAAHCFEAEFIGGNSSRIISNSDPVTTRFNFFLGNDPSKWGTLARAFPEIEMKDLYAGVDVKIFHNGGHLKYDLIAQKADAIKNVKIIYKGLKGLSVRKGKLTMKTSIGNLVEGIPLAYQTIKGKRVRLNCRYKLEGNTVGFEFPDGYDHRFPLVVDPELIFYTFSGSTIDNWGSSAVGDATGNSYVAGTVYGPNFPFTLGALDNSFNGVGTPTFTFDLGIQKFNPAGTQLLFSTYLGGSEADSPHSLNVDKNQNLLIFGTTSSPNFPVNSNAFQTQFKGGPIIEPTSSNFSYRQGSDLFVTRLKSDGSAILGSTFLGGTLNEGVLAQTDPITMNYGDAFRGDIATGPDGSVFIASHTRSANFPIRQASQPGFEGGIDGVVCRLSPNLDSLKWSTFLGGSEQDVLFSIQLQGTEKVVVCGGSRSQNFPVSPNSYQSQISGTGLRKNAFCDAVLASFSFENGARLGSTFSGTSSYDQGYLLQTDEAGNIFVLGQTEGIMPKSPACFGQEMGRIFIQKFSPDLSTLIWGTTLGQNSNSALVPSAFLVDSCERIYFSGWGGDSNYSFDLGFTGGSTLGFPTTPGALKTTTDGSDFYFGVLGKNATTLTYGTFYGGNVRGEHVDGGMSRFDKSGTITQASCGCRLGNQYFPGTPGSYQPEIKSTNCNQGVIRIDLGQTKAKFSFNAESACGQTITFTNLSSLSNNFIWYWGDGDSLVTNQLTVSHLFAFPGTYIVTLKAISGEVCNKDAYFTDTITVFNPFTFESDTTRFYYCKGDIVTPEFQTEPGVTGRWLSTHDFIGGNVFNPIIGPTSPFVYTIEFRTLQGCKKNRYFQTIPKTPIQLDIKDSFALNPCQGKGMVYLKAKGNSADFYKWEIGNQRFNGPVFPVNLDSGLPFIVKLKGSLEGCLDSINYQVIPPPFDFQLKPDFETTKVILNCRDSEIKFSNLTQNALSFSWNFGDGTQSEDISPTHQYPESGQFIVRLTARNQFCDSTLSKTISYRQIIIPNLVTPNRDGKNDLYEIKGIDEEFSFEVFNRWGEKMYSSAVYKNDWSPTNLNEGIYFFQIRFKSGFSCLNWLDLAR